MNFAWCPFKCVFLVIRWHIWPLVSSDDSASAASSMEVTDRIASLEQRVQMQEDEIQLLKSALADVVRRLNHSEEQQAMGSRRGPTKGNTEPEPSLLPLLCFSLHDFICFVELFLYVSSSCQSLLQILLDSSDQLSLSPPPRLCCFVNCVVQ